MPESLRPHTLRAVFAAAFTAALVLIGAVACGGSDTNLNPTRELTDEDRAAMTAITNETGETFDIRTTSTMALDTPCAFAIDAMTRIASDASFAADGDEATIKDARATLTELPGELPESVAPIAQEWATRMSQFFDDPTGQKDEIISANWIAHTAEVQQQILAACP